MTGKRRTKHVLAPLSVKKRRALLSANRYHALSNDKKKSEQEREAKPPPIIVSTNEKSEVIQTTLIEIGVVDFALKWISIEQQERL